jgi:predicted glycosyltransferase involved in capsule biosynthesis
MSGEYQAKAVTEYGGEEKLDVFVSVVVPFSSGEYLERLEHCLDSIRGQQRMRQERVEIVLVYLAKEPEELEPAERLARKYKARLLYRLHEHDHFPLALARNIGAKHASGNLLLFVDADMVLDPEVLCRTISHGPKRVVAVWTKYLRKNFPQSAVFSLDAKEFRKGIVRGSVVAGGYGGFLSVPRVPFIEVGGYDEAYDVGWGAEDNDLVDRLCELGLKTGLLLVNLTQTQGILNAHQWHRRLDHSHEAGTIQNRTRYNEAKTIERNPKGWGKLDMEEEGRPQKQDEPKWGGLIKHKAGNLVRSGQLQKVSVIISLSTDDYALRLRRCLHSLDGQVGINRSCFEIIFAVVQREPDEVQPVPQIAGIAEEYGVEVVMHHYKAPAFNLALSRNVGAQRATGDVLCFLDADMVLHPGTFREALQRVSVHRHVVVLASYTTEDCPEDAYQSSDPKQYQRVCDEHATLGETGFGGCLFVHRAAFCRVGGYDEEYVGWGAEDNDLCRRLEKFGSNLANLTEQRGISALHQWHPSRKGAEEKFQIKNRERYRDRGLGLTRNVGGCGGYTSGITTVMMHHPLRPGACLRKSLRALEGATAEWREHTVDLFIQGPIKSKLPNPDNFAFELNIVQLPENQGLAIPPLQSLKWFRERRHTWWSKVDDDILMPKGGLEDLIKVLQYESGLGEINVGAAQMSTGPGSWVHTTRIFVLGKETDEQGRPHLFLRDGHLVERNLDGIKWRVADSSGWGSTVFHRRVFDTCMPDPQYFLGVVDTDLFYQMHHQGMRVALIASPSCEQLVNECYNSAYTGVRFNVNTIRKSGRLFSKKWGVYHKRLVEYKK